MTKLTYTGEDMGGLSLHDNPVYGLYFSVGDVDLEDWTSDLVLDIDYIVEWICGARGGAHFLISPATLKFHDVTDLKIDIDWGEIGHRAYVHEVTIDSLTRERVVVQGINLPYPYYRWRIDANWPRGGEITFGAKDFTLILRAEPVDCDQQRISPAQRKALFQG